MRSSARSCRRATAWAPFRLPGTRSPTAPMRWAGADVVLGPLIDQDSPLSKQFELRDLTLVRRVELDGRPGHRCHRRGPPHRGRRHSWRPTSWWWPPMPSAPRSCSGHPASGPQALGHYLTEHPVVISTVALDAERMGRFATEEDLEAELARRAMNPADPVAAVNRIPFSEPDHPFSAPGHVHRDHAVPDGAGTPRTPSNRWGYVNMGYGMRKHPRYEDAVTFDDDEPDYRGFPNMTNRVRAHERRKRGNRRGNRAAAACRQGPRRLRGRAQAHAERLEPALPGHDAHG